MNYTCSSVHPRPEQTRMRRQHGKSQRLALLLTVLGHAGAGWANGLALNEQSASSFGTAYAGRSSAALDASTVYGNPAGLSRLARAEVSGGLALVAVRDRISDANSAASGTNDGNSVPLSGIPFGYLSVPIDERFTFGLGVYVPFGLVNDYESTFQGRYHGSYSKVQVKTLQPTLAYRVNERVSVGGGITLNRVDNNLQSYLATGALNGGKDTHITIRGNDTALGLNLGLMVGLDDATTWGTTYHSKVAFRSHGHTELEGTPAAFNLDGKYENRIDNTMPESLDTSLAHRFDERWTGYLGAVWTRWSRIQRVEAVNSGISPLGLQLGFGAIGDDFNWHDTWSAALGASYQLSPQWLLRSGFAYDQSPARVDYRNVRVPVGNRKAFTLGAAYSPRKELTIDIAYGYLWEPTTRLDQANISGVQPSYSANFHNSANVISTQLSYRF